MPKLYISNKTRKALLEAGFPIQSINNWKSGRHKPSRLAKNAIEKIISLERSRKENNPA